MASPRAGSLCAHPTHLFACSPVPHSAHQAQCPLPPLASGTSAPRAAWAPAGIRRARLLPAGAPRRDCRSRRARHTWDLCPCVCSPVCLSRPSSRFLCLLLSPESVLSPCVSPRPAAAQLGPHPASLWPLTTLSPQRQEGRGLADRWDSGPIAAAGRQDEPARFCSNQSQRPARTSETRPPRSRRRLVEPWCRTSLRVSPVCARPPPTASTNRRTRGWLRKL